MHGSITSSVKFLITWWVMKEAISKWLVMSPIKIRTYVRKNLWAKWKNKWGKYWLKYFLLLRLNGNLNDLICSKFKLIYDNNFLNQILDFHTSINNKNHFKQKSNIYEFFSWNSDQIFEVPKSATTGMLYGVASVTARLVELKVRDFSKSRWIFLCAT